MADLTGRDYVRFLFDDIEDGLLLALRQELTEFTETDPHDPLIQLARMVAFTGHRDASMIDLVASELAWPTLQRRRSAIALARLVGQSLTADSPASCDVLLDLSSTPGPADIVLADLALMRTPGDADNASVAFESTEGDITVGNLEFTSVEYDATVFGVPAVGAIAPPWTGPITGDAVYYGHAELQFDGIKITAAGVPNDYTVVTEYYDGRFRQTRPDDGTVVQVGTGIEMGVNGLMDQDTHRALDGLVVRVLHNDTGLYEDVIIASSGGVNEATTATLLGQSVVSTDPSDYTVSAEWLPLPDVDRYEALGTSYVRDLDYRLPSDLLADGTATDRKWQKSTIAGTEAYWLRERVVVIGAVPVSPTSVTATVGTEQVWSILAEGLQGQTVVDVLGRTTGLAFESLELSDTGYIGNSLSVLNVAGDTDWGIVDSLFNSQPEDKHAILVQNPDETYSVTFGDGTNGRMPAAGSLVTATYRVGAADDGNVGANTVSNVEAGSNFLTNARNPRAASGWRQRQGATTEALKRVKVMVPNGVRSARSVIVTTEDLEFHAVQTFVTADGRQPFERVAAVEQGAGFKTVLAVCVGAGGTVPSASDIAELQVALNGYKVGFQRFGGLTMANQEIIATAYTPLPMTLTITLEVVEKYAPFARAKALSALIAATNPLATSGDDGAYRWVPGGKISDAAYKTIIGLAKIDGLVDVTIVAAPALPTTLAKTELPTLATTPAITVTEV